MMKSITEVNLTTSRIIAVLTEMEKITSKQNPTKSDEMRHTQLLAEFAALKSGISPTELAQARCSALARELGQAEPFRASISRGAFEEWRDWLASDERELRTDSQSTSMWGNVTGLTTDGAAGVFVPATAPFTDRIYAMLASTDELIDPANCRVWTSERGSAGAVPFIKDYVVSGSPATAAFNKSTIVDEAYQSNTVQFATDKLAFGKVPTWRSGRIAIALELAQDAPDLFAGTVQLLESVFAQRFALGFGAYAVAQLLANLPTIQNVTSEDNALIYPQDLVNLYGALPPVYRKNAVIVCSDTVRSKITGAFEGTIRTMVGPVNEALRVPIAISPSMPAWGAGVANAAVIVDKRYLVQRRVKNGGNIVRLYKEAVGIIEQGLQAVEHFGRADFGVVNLADPYFSPAAVLNIKS